MNRRSLLSTALTFGAASAAVASGAAIVVPAAQASSEVSPTVSPVMQKLVSDFVMTSVRQEAADTAGDADAAASAARDRSTALVALAFHAPENLLELAAKTSALVEFTADTERFALRVLAEDAARLAGSAAK